MEQTNGGAEVEAPFAAHLHSDTADMAKIIKLESVFSRDMGNAHHMLVDIAPGHGKLEGKTVLTLHFGSLYLAGALS